MGSDNGHQLHLFWCKKVIGSVRTRSTIFLAWCSSCFIVLLLLLVAIRVRRNDGQKKCDVSFGSYHGVQYTTREGGTVGTPHCLVESKWMKVQQHSVQMPGSESIIHDWLWIDYHDRINVLVEAESRNPQGERQFLVFEQSKYALEGRTSLAIIGGIIEPGEEAEEAARREVEEEMQGLQCDTFHSLGRFRTDVNRGMGWVNSFFATNCSRKKQNNNNNNNNKLSLSSSSSSTTTTTTTTQHDTTTTGEEEEEVGIADIEGQNLKKITLTQLRDAVRRGEFLEVQWSATVSLALLQSDVLSELHPN